MRENKSLQASFTVLLLLSIISAFYYLIFLLDFRNISNIFLYGVLLLVESYVILQTIGTWWTLLYTDQDYRDHLYWKGHSSLLKNPEIGLEIAVFITTYGEDLEIIKATALAAKEMSVTHKTYILDDAKSESVKDLANQIGVEYITRDTNIGKKAGNINNALRLIKADFVAIFDADHIPKKEFLLKTLPFFHNSNLAFVQTPQNFRNRENLIAAGTADSQRMFYDLVGNGKNKFNAMFWVGTNAIFRKSAIDEIGGVIEHSSEDVLTAYKLHENGWKSIYFAEVLATGLAPDTLEAYYKQQERWAGGGFTLFFKQNPLFSKLNFDQKFQYFLTSTFYFSGLVVLCMQLLPVIYLYFGTQPIQADNLDWLVHYIPFFGLQFFAVMVLMGKLSWQAYVLSINSFPAYIKAFFQTIIGKEIKWNVTTATAKNGKKSILPIIWPNVALLLVNLLCIPLAILKIDRDMGTVLFSLFWVSLNSMTIWQFLVSSFEANHTPKDVASEMKRLGLDKIPANEPLFKDKPLVISTTSNLSQSNNNLFQF